MRWILVYTWVRKLSFLSSEDSGDLRAPAAVKVSLAPVSFLRHTESWCEHG